jgi:hypothetical protein
MSAGIVLTNRGNMTNDLTDEEKKKIEAWAYQFSLDRVSSGNRWDKILEKQGPIPLDTPAAREVASSRLRLSQSHAWIRFNADLADQPELEYWDSVTTWFDDVYLR